MKNLLFFTTLTIAQVCFAQKTTYQTTKKKHTATCQFCKKSATEFSLIKLDNLNNYKHLAYVYRAEMFSDRAIYYLRYSECKSSLNKTNEHEITINEETVTERKELNVQENYETDFWLRNSLATFIRDNESFSKVVDENTYNKFIKYRNTEESLDLNAFNMNVTKLNILIEEKDFVNAAKLYTELQKSKFFVDLNLKPVIMAVSIQIGLDDLFKQKSTLTNVESQKIIQSYSGSFQQLLEANKLSSFKIEFDRKGNGTYNGQPINIKNENPPLLFESGDFKVFGISEANFVVTKRTIIDNSFSNPTIWVSTNSKISKTNKNQIFKKNILSASYFKGEESVIRDSRVPFKQYWLVNNCIDQIFVNDKILFEVKTYQKISENNFKKRGAMKIFRGSIFAGILGWFSLRLVEISSVK